MELIKLVIGEDDKACVTCRYPQGRFPRTIELPWPMCPVHFADIAEEEWYQDMQATVDPLTKSGRFAFHGSACSDEKEATHRYALSDSGWWCLGCKAKLVNLIPPHGRAKPEDTSVPSCCACLATIENGNTYMVTIRPDYRVVAKEHP